MNEPGRGSHERRFETAEEELAHLRERVGEYERDALEHGLLSPERAAREAVRDYAGLQPEIVLHPEHQIEEGLAGDIALGLLHDLFDAGRLDAAVLNELLQRDLGHLAADAVER